VPRKTEAGSTLVEVCRKPGISQQSFYLWKKSMSETPSELRLALSGEGRLTSMIKVAQRHQHSFLH
jgi:transposase-like protein